MMAAARVVFASPFLRERRKVRVDQSKCCYM